MVLRRGDGALVTAFSIRDSAPEAVRRAVEEAVQGEFAEGHTVAEADPAEDGLSLGVRFFGSFEILCDGEVVPVGRGGKALSILKYLLADPGRPVSQDHLMGWLWPDSSLRKARWSLNSAVHALRKILSGCPPLSAERSVLLEEGYYRLCPAIAVSTDVDEFDTRYENGRRLEEAGRAAEAVSEYEKAVGLYRGDYLIEDLYEDWTMVERERLINAYVDVLDRLAARYMEAGRPHEGIRTCYRILEKDRCHEDGYRLLMRGYARLGMRTQALQQYRLCEKVLRREYGMAPSPETRTLYESILTR
jgi:DNA-binding SARP family transcriptional activator